MSMIIKVFFSICCHGSYLPHYATQQIYKNFWPIHIQLLRQHRIFIPNEFIAEESNCLVAKRKILTEMRRDEAICHCHAELWNETHRKWQRIIAEYLQVCEEKKRHVRHKLVEENIKLTFDSRKTRERLIKEQDTIATTEKLLLMYLTPKDYHTEERKESDKKFIATLVRMICREKRDELLYEQELIANDQRRVRIAAMLYELDLYD